MSRDEAEAVLGHEVSHVANGDMVTMALLQGVMNTFVIVLSRVVGRVVDSLIFGNRDSGPGFGYFIIVFVLDMIFGLFASFITAWFSRQREFRADSGGAAAGRQGKDGSPLCSAWPRTTARAACRTQIAAFGISGGLKSGIGALMMNPSAAGSTYPGAARRRLIKRCQQRKKPP